MALKAIKNKIRSTERTRKVTKAMESVSAVKMRKSQDRALKGRAYARSALRILKRVGESGEGAAFLSRVPQGGKTLAIVITSDKGLAGSLNSAVLKELGRFLAGKNKKSMSFICVGRKGYEYLMFRGYEVLRNYINLGDDISLEDMREITGDVVAQYGAGIVSEVYVVHQNFLSTFEQKPKQYKILPISVESLEEVIRDIAPKNAVREEREKAVVSYIVEPSEETIFRTLFPQLVQIAVYHALLEAKASEHSARMVAMKSASDKAVEVGKTLTLKYNKERQSVITREVSEIVGGIEAMKS